MKIDIKRRPSAHGCTISDWYIDGQHQCYGIEDVVRPYGVYVKDETAIPTGTYKVIVDRSTRFSAAAGHDVFLPHLLDMPGQVRLFGGRPVGECGIRLHPGNFAVDSSGCCLPGTAVAPDGKSVESSRVAFSVVFAKIQKALNDGQAVTLTIQ